MKAKMDNEEILASLHATSADIQRWILQAAMKGKISNDRKRDFALAASWICELIGKFNND